MAKMVHTLILVALVAACVIAAPGERLTRGYNNGGYGNSGSGYGSDERDASEEGGGCSSGNGYANKGYNSGSLELAYNRDGRPSGETRGGRSFAKSSSSAAASATSFNLNQKSNGV